MTEAEILDRLALYLAAERKILEGAQSHSIAGTTFTRADLRAVQAEITRLRGELALVQSGGSFGCQPVVFGGRR
jgi:hypothetical protein